MKQRTGDYTRMPSPDESNHLLEKLKTHSKTTDTGCLEWSGARTGAGYGEVCLNNRIYFAHRLSWMLHHGRPIPKGMCILHHCDNPPCWNPDHLFIGNAQTNTDDKITKGRMRHGHLYGDDHPSRTHPETYLKYGEDHQMAKLTWKIVRKIRMMYMTGNRTHAEIAKVFNVSRPTISSIVAGRHWKENQTKGQN